MAQGFYSLEEAATALGMTPDDLNKMAQRREIRAFSDRGTWRFRAQDVDDLVKQRGGVAAPAAPAAVTPATGGDLLPVDDLPPPPRKTAAKPKSQVKKVDSDLIPMDDDIFGADLDSLSSTSNLDPVKFDEDDDVLLGGDIGGFKPASGSGQKLVKEDASFEFELTSDSDVRLEDDSTKKKKTATAPGSGRLAPVPASPGGDSDVRLDFAADAVPGDSLASVGERPMSGLNLDEVPLITEEIDLDTAEKEAEEDSQKRIAGKTKAFPPPAKQPGPAKTKATPPAKGTMLPDASPFELSEDDLDTAGSSESEEPLHKPMGSEFELTLAPEDGAPLDLEEDVDLGELPARSESPSGNRAELSGINLHDPADSGISLEEDEDADDSVSFELTLDDADAGPKTIKGKLPAAEDSDSEFELTLDDAGLASSSPSLKGAAAGEEKDIFETDFDLPALDDESASQAVALDEEDTDLESSDFDLAVESSPNLGKHKSDSGSVALEEDETAGSDPDISSVDEMLVEEEEQAEDYSGLEEDEEEDEEEDAVATVPAAQVEWGITEVLMMGVCVVLMFVSGLMAFEILRGSNGYQSTSKPFGVVARGVAGVFGSDDLKE